MIKSFLLILVSNEEAVLKEKRSLELSLASGIITSFLQEQGIASQLYDVNRYLMDRPISQVDKNLMALLYDGRRVINYLYGDIDEELDSLARLLLGKDWQTYDSYGISVGADFSLFEIHMAMVLAKYLKKEGEGPVILGGNNISYLYIFKDFYKDLLRAAIDNLKYVVKGPGERVIGQILKSINAGIPEEKILEEVSGLLYLEEGQIVGKKEADPIVTCPDWGQVDLETYGYPLSNSQKENENILYRFPLAITRQVIEFNRRKDKERQLFIPYIFNYNCSYACAFCTQSDGDRGEVVIGEVERIVDDIERLSKRYSSKYFYFLNNYFPSSLNFIKSFNRILEAKGLEIYWSDCGRVNGMTYEKLALLYESGCRKLVFGFETGDPWMLDFINKRLDLEELIQVLRWCKEIGIWADLEVIIGLPYEGEKEFLNTYEFLHKHRELINNFWLNEYFLIPNSLIGSHPNQYKIELIKDLYDYDSLLAMNREGFLNDNLSNMTSNSRLWGFNELEEDSARDYSQIQEDNKGKIKRLAELRNPEFNQLFKFYSSMSKIREGQ